MEYHSVTTLNEIRECGPCDDSWKKLLSHLGKTEADDEPLPLLTILESNGLADALWCLRAKSLDRLSRHFQAWCAARVEPLFRAAFPGDTRVSDQIAMLRRDDAAPHEREAAEAAAAAVAARAAQATAWAAQAEALAEAEAERDAAWAEARAAQEEQLRAMIGAPSLPEGGPRE